MKDAIESGNGRISFQVVQETLNVLTSKIQTPLSSDDARRFLDGILMPLWRGMPSQSLYHRALDIKARYRYGFYDSMILAAALQSNCDRLISEDMQSGQQIGTLVIHDPFA